LGLLQGVTASVIGQFIGATAGLGFLEIQAQEAADIKLVFVCIFLLSFIGYMLYSVVALLEKKMVKRYV
jgi:NitT/TauT family transport system permease protein